MEGRAAAAAYNAFLKQAVHGFSLKNELFRRASLVILRRICYNHI